jgi:hypothetical protein
LSKPEQVRVSPGQSRIEDPLRDVLKTCCRETPTVQHIIYNIHPSHPKTSPHPTSHHQCADPRIDSLVSPHLESKCSGPLHKESHPKPGSDRVMTPSRARISSPLATAREQRPYRAPNRNVTHVIKGSRSWSTKLRWENSSVNRPVNRDTGLEMPCCPVTDLLWV